MSCAGLCMPSQPSAAARLRSSTIASSTLDAPAWYCRADMTVTNGNEATGVQNCNSGSTATVTLTGSYSKASSWNVGAKLDVSELWAHTVTLLSYGHTQSHSKCTSTHRNA